MARLDFLEASRGAAAGDGGNAAEDGDLQQQQQQQLEEELGFVHDLLRRCVRLPCTVVISFCIACNATPVKKQIGSLHTISQMQV